MDSKSGMLFSDSLYYYVLYSNYGDLGRMYRILHMILWGIWNQRNSQLLNNIGLPPQRLQSVLAYLRDWHAAKEDRSQHSSIGQDPTNVKWNKPLPRIVKCNVDVATSHTKLTIGVQNIRMGPTFLKMWRLWHYGSH